MERLNFIKIFWARDKPSKLSDAWTLPGSWQSWAKCWMPTSLILITRTSVIIFPCRGSEFVASLRSWSCACSSVQIKFLLIQISYLPFAMTFLIFDLRSSNKKLFYQPPSLLKHNLPRLTQSGLSLGLKEFIYSDVVTAPKSCAFALETTNIFYIKF